jgi:hypothetical protein
MPLRRNPSTTYERNRGAAPHPADRDLRIGPCVALLGEVFQVLADAGLLHMELLTSSTSPLKIIVGFGSKQ